MKLAHTESQVNQKPQPFWVKRVYLVPNVPAIAGHAVGVVPLAPTTTLHFDTLHKKPSIYSILALYFLFFDTTLPNHKKKYLLRKVINMNLLFLNNTFFLF